MTSLQFYVFRLSILMLKSMFKQANNDTALNGYTSIKMCRQKTLFRLKIAVRCDKNSMNLLQI